MTLYGAAAGIQDFNTDNIDNTDPYYEDYEYYDMT